MLLADVLGRYPSRSSEETKLDMRVNYIAFSKAWIAMFKKATLKEPIYSTVYQLTQQDYPHQQRDVP